MWLEAAGADRLELLGGLQSLWERGRLCDLTLQSRDGACFEAHRLVLSAASEPLAALLDGRFAESRGGPVSLDASSGALSTVLQYLYCGSAQVQPEDAPEALRFAHVYGLRGLEERIACSLPRHLDAALALRSLIECELLSFDELEAECERCIAEHFEESARSGDFTRLSASQLGRVLRHEALTVTNEEAVLKAVLVWHRAVPGRDACLGVLLQHVRFPLMALSSLCAVEAHAQAMGPGGVDLQREARKGLKTHRTGGIRDDTPVAKRRCLPYWWPGLGASVGGGVVVAGGHGRGEDPQHLKEPISLAIHDGALLVADAGNRRIVRWAPGAAAGQVVAGRGAPLNGVNELGSSFKIAVDPEGRLLVADRDNNRVLQFDDAGGQVLGEGRWRLDRPWAVRAPAGGAVYVLDDDGTRIQKLEGGTATVVAGGHGPGCQANQFHAANFVVADDGAVFVADDTNHRVQRWAPGGTEGTTVAGGNGAGSAAHELHTPCGLCVTADRAVHVVELANHRVVMWPAGAPSGVVVAGGHGRGAGTHQLAGPADVAIDAAGAIYVAEFDGHRVTRWGPAPGLQLEKSM